MLTTGKYNYRLKQIDYNGNYKYYQTITVDINYLFNYKLYQNYPNPFNPFTKINFSLAEKTYVKIILYDVTGKEIKYIVNDTMDAGYHSVQFNSENLSSGVYLYRMTTSSGYTAVKKLIILK